MKLFAPAKINLCLHICGKYPDGYHNIDSLVTFCSVGDVVCAHLSDRISLEIVGEFSEALQGSIEENFIIVCAKAIRETTGKEIGAKLILKKNLPVSSGMGGGSTDAGATIQLLQKLWKIELESTQVLEIANLCGTDTISCVYRKNCRITGRGNDVSYGFKLPPLQFVLVNPNVKVKTPDVFKRVDINKHCSGELKIPDFEASQMSEFIIWLKEQRNDLEQITVEICPQVGQVLECIRNTPQPPLLSRMSGSGATCYGIYEDVNTAKIAADHIRMNNPKWWVKSASSI